MKRLDRLHEPKSAGVVQYHIVTTRQYGPLRVERTHTLGSSACCLSIGRPVYSIVKEPLASRGRTSCGRPVGRPRLKTGKSHGSMRPEPRDKRCSLKGTSAPAPQSVQDIYPSSCPWSRGKGGEKPYAAGGTLPASTLTTQPAGPASTELRPPFPQRAQPATPGPGDPGAASLRGPQMAVDGRLFHVKHAPAGRGCFT
jgi:hypothetical protein